MFYFALRMYAAMLFHVNTGIDPGFSFIEVYPTYNNCSQEIAVFIYSSGALCLVVILKCVKLLFRYEWRVHIPNFYCTLRGLQFHLQVSYCVGVFRRNLTCPTCDLGT